MAKTEMDPRDAERHLERELLKQLNELRQSYVKAAQPIIDELVRIRNARVEPLFIPHELWTEIMKPLPVVRFKGGEE